MLHVSKVPRLPAMHGLGRNSGSSRNSTGDDYSDFAHSGSKILILVWFLKEILNLLKIKDKVGLHTKTLSYKCKFEPGWPLLAEILYLEILKS